MTYEYLCSSCAHLWDAEQSISSAPLKTCPSCGKDTAKRQVSGGAGFILKGGGWYADLYSSQKPSAQPGEKSGTESAQTKPAGDAAGAGSGGSASAGAASSSGTAAASASSAGASTSGGSSKQGSASAS